MKMSVEKNEATNMARNEDNRSECRICLEKSDADSITYNLFEAWTLPWEGMESTVAEDLTKLANIQISKTDRHSKIICEMCWSRLQDACHLVAIAKRNDWILRQRYTGSSDEHSHTVWPKPIQLDKNINGTVYENAMDVEIKQEVLSEEECLDNTVKLEDEYREPGLDLEIKLEPEEIIEPKPLQITINGTISLNQHKTEISTLTNGGETCDKDKFMKPTDPVKEEPLSDEEDLELVSSDLPLECMLCTKDFKSVSGLKAHVISQHSYKTVKRKIGDEPSPEKKRNNDKHTCVRCRRNFLTSTDLMVHETCHNKWVCYSCNEDFDSFEHLSNHRKCCKTLNSKEVLKPKTLEDVKRPQQPVTEDTVTSSDEALTCPICKDKFSDAYYLKIHQEVHHTVANEQIESIQPNEVAMETESLESIFGGDN